MLFLSFCCRLRSWGVPWPLHCLLLKSHATCLVPCPHRLQLEEGGAISELLRQGETVLGSCRFSVTSVEGLRLGEVEELQVLYAALLRGDGPPTVQAQ